MKQTTKFTKGCTFHLCNRLNKDPPSIKGMTRAGGCAQNPIKGTMLGCLNLQNMQFGHNDNYTFRYDGICTVLEWPLLFAVVLTI